MKTIIDKTKYFDLKIIFGRTEKIYIDGNLEIKKYR